jgi:hypothetical protein
MFLIANSMNCWRSLDSSTIEANAVMKNLKDSLHTAQTHLNNIERGQRIEEAAADKGY